MLSTLAGITILLLAAWLTAGACRRSSAATRHVIWTCAIAATLLYIPLRRCVPEVAINRPIPFMLKPTPAAVDSAIAITSSGAPGSPRESTLDFSNMATSIWILGSILFALRYATGALRFRRVMNNAREINRAFPVPLLKSRLVPGPLVAGILRPKILLPEDSAEWNSARRRAVLAHELAHIRRRDPAILLLAQTATIVYWFHPLCWFAAARLRLESERACDDAVLRIGLRPSSYAGELRDLALLFNPQPAIPMATTTHLECRVTSILNPLVNRSFAAGRTWVAAAAITSLLTAPLTVLTLRAQVPARQTGAAVQITGTGTINGTVIDPTGAVVPRVTVIASRLEGGNKEIARTDEVGNFTFNNIPAGNYSIEARAPGFAAFRSDLSVSNGGSALALVRLKAGGVAESVTVLAAGSPRRMPASTSPPVRIRVGGNVQPVSLIEQVRPVYPAGLQSAGIEGNVLIEAVISKDGVPDSLVPQTTSVDPAFVNAAMDAVRQWRYRPALLNGEPVAVSTTINVDFRLQPLQ